MLTEAAVGMAGRAGGRTAVVGRGRWRRAAGGVGGGWGGLAGEVGRDAIEERFDDLGAAALVERGNGALGDGLDEPGSFVRVRHE